MKPIVAAASASLLLLAACGPAPSSGGGGGGTDGGIPAPEFPARHATYPLAVDHGGGVLAHPRLVTISFTGYAHADKLKAFGENIVKSNWLQASGAPYGVHDGTYLGNFVFDTSPTTASGNGTASFIESHIRSGELPAAKKGEAPILYMVFYNLGVPILTGPNNDASCSTFAGFHQEASFATGRFAFAVLPQCPGDDWTYIETAASHELIEAATDPWPSSAPGWYVDSPSSPWMALGAEVGDECIDLVVTEGQDTYQRVWSNAAAASGNQNPCVPVKSGVQFGVTTTSDTTIVAHPGKDLTIHMHGWSAAARDPWSVDVFTWSEDFAGNPFLESSTMNNGDTDALHITIPAGTPAGSSALYLVVAHGASGSYSSTFWPVQVTVGS